MHNVSRAFTNEWWRKAPRFCLVCTYPPSADAIAPLARDLAEEVAKSAEVVFLAPKNGVRNEVDSPGGVRLLRCWTPVFYPVQVLMAVLRERVNAVHVQQEFFLYGQSTYSASLFPILLILLRMAHRPSIVTVHHVIPLQLVAKMGATVGVRFPLAAKMFLILYYRILGLASAVIVPRNDQRSILVHDYHLKASKVWVIPHAIMARDKPSGITPAEARERLGISAKYAILFFGFIRPTKGLDILLRALAVLKSRGLDVILLVVGIWQQRYTGYFRRIHDAISENDLAKNVVLAGYVPEERLSLFFEASNVVVFPYTEAGIEASAAFLRAAGYGCPIIATNIGEFPLLKSDGAYCTLVPPSNHIQLAAALEQTLTHGEMTAVAAEEAAGFKRKRSIELQAQEHIQVYLKAWSNGDRRNGARTRT